MYLYKSVVVKLVEPVEGSKRFSSGIVMPRILITLTLSLFVARISFADYINIALSTDYLTLSTYLFDRSFYLHKHMTEPPF